MQETPGRDGVTASTTSALLEESQYHVVCAPLTSNLNIFGITAMMIRLSLLWITNTDCHSTRQQNRNSPRPWLSDRSRLRTFR